MFAHHASQAATEHQDEERAEMAEHHREKLTAHQQYGMQEHTDYVTVYRFTTYDDIVQKHVEEIFIDPFDGVKQVRVAYHRMMHRERDMARFFGYNDITTAIQIPYIHALLMHYDFDNIRTACAQQYPKLESIITSLSFTIHDFDAAQQYATPQDSHKARGMLQFALQRHAKYVLFNHIGQSAETLHETPLEWVFATLPTEDTVYDMVRQYAHAAPHMRHTTYPEQI